MPEFPLDILLKIIKLARSTYYYHLKQLKQEDKNHDIKTEIQTIYTEHKGNYGYRRITLELRNRGFIINQKKVQCLMKILGLSARIRRKRKYSSYRGEVGKKAENIIQRQFKAEKPMGKCYTDITEFSIPTSNQKIYLSPISDGYNSEIIAYILSSSPNLKQVKDVLEQAFGEEYEGTKEFRAFNGYDVFRNKTVNYTDIKDGGLGMSQNDTTVPAGIRIDLKDEDWFTFTDNFGTSEEKVFVAYFRDYVDVLKKIYSKGYLMRNERQMHIYSFDGGERFEPDNVFFLQKDNIGCFEQLQVFIEPKGTYLVESDKWKEDFLLQLKDNAFPVKTFVDDNNYHIWGFHFVNRDVRGTELKTDIETLKDIDTLGKIIKYPESQVTLSKVCNLRNREGW